MEYFVEIRDGERSLKDALYQLCKAGDVEGVMILMFMTFQSNWKSGSSQSKGKNDPNLFAWKNGPRELSGKNKIEDPIVTFCAVSPNTESSHILTNRETQNVSPYEKEMGKDESFSNNIKLKNTGKEKINEVIQNSPETGVNSLTWDPLLLWFRPSYCCLHEIASQIKNAGLNRVSSVGCGSGLLEWLLWQVTGVEVLGYEVNQQWWESSYSPPKFIPHVYADAGNETTTAAIPSNHALFCCYFNGGETFRNYVDRYEGTLLIIIGPTDGFRHTDPHPLDYKDSPNWNLKSVHNQEDKDLIAFYTRSIS